MVAHCILGNWRTDVTEKTRRAKRHRTRLDQRNDQRRKRRAWVELPRMTWEDDGGALHPRELED